MKNNKHTENNLGIDKQLDLKVTNRAAVEANRIMSIRKKKSITESLKINTLLSRNRNISRS